MNGSCGMDQESSECPTDKLSDGAGLSNISARCDECGLSINRWRQASSSFKQRYQQVVEVSLPRLDDLLEHGEWARVDDNAVNIAGDAVIRHMPTCRAVRLSFCPRPFSSEVSLQRCFI
jgi:hypothetical protein